MKNMGESDKNLPKNKQKFLCSSSQSALKVNEPHVLSAIIISRTTVRDSLNFSADLLVISQTPLMR